MPSIIVKNLSKKFYIETRPVTTFRLLSNIFKKRRTIMALKNVNFQVEDGDCVGLIGDNGSGKTTLLRIMGDIYDKTTGSVKIEGKMVPVIRLDSGLARELRAQQNIYLLGMILGLKRKEIESKFNKIVKFAGIENFLNTPLKDFSSGMIERLSFAIIPQLKADVYLFDEVFVMGDIHFREKVLDVFKNLVKQKKTIIVITHEMDFVEKFCNKALLLKNGRVLKYGRTSKILKYYRQLESQGIH